ncbi:MAG TPA: ferrous iron transport protein B [Methanomicrobiales archaeon]|nr:ferrous iron transport protein B [Methanomicrobiales archaeon]
MRFALVGNPNVGKSLIFNQLTGLGVEVSNYPGTTVALHQGAACVEREKVEIVDLPGIYSIDGDAEEEVLARRILSAGDLDGAILVLNATNLERNLYLLLQVAETGIPLVAVVNMMDEAEASGLSLDLTALSATLGVDVLGTSAVSGRNIGQIIPLALARARPASIAVPYDTDVEAAVRTLEKELGASRVQAIWALDGIGTDKAIGEAAADLAREIEETHRMSVHQIMALNRYTLSREIAGKVVKRGGTRAGPDLDELLSREIPGIPILAGILLGMLLLVFVVGGFLETLIVGLFQEYAIAPILSLGLPPLLEKVVVSAVVGLQAGFGIAFPYILLFFILISILEDSGYMTRAAFLADRAMHRVGMHGGAIIPMVLAFGCNVPAIMATRNLGTRRERLIASFLITMVPCSARTVIIAGMVATFVGIPAALSIYAVVFLVIALTGALLSRVTPGRQMGMILEVAPLRWPKAHLALAKSWHRLLDFLMLAIPLLIAGSIVLGVLEYLGVLAAFEDLFAPIFVGLLGLPSYAVTALLFGILRKEMAIGTLAVLAGTADFPLVMTRLQIYIFALMSTLFVPCISTMAVLSRENGWKAAAMITVYTVLLGIGIGAMINHIFA